MKSKEEEYQKSYNLACIIKYPNRDATPIDKWIIVEGHTDK